jgi:hypothetical protein
MTDDDRTDADQIESLHLDDLVSGPEDLPDLRNHIKTLRDELNEDRDDDAQLGVGDLLPLTPKNDIGYLRPSEIEAAEWIADIYEKEGEPEIHPRGLHYQLLGKGYERRNGEPYRNSDECWAEVKQSLKWARVLGLVDSDNIRDDSTNEPIYGAFDDPDNADTFRTTGATGRAADGVQTRAFEEAVSRSRVHDGFQSARIQTTLKAATLTHSDYETFVDAAITALVDYAFSEVDYDLAAHQPYYVELWAEKGGVIPEEIADEYGATIRSKKGELSLSMCEEAINVAEQRGQDLVVITITDHDPKGADMPKAAGRKLEILSAMSDADIDVEVVHGALTADQVHEYELPGEPAKTPRGLDEGNTGAKGYETHKELFRDAAGQHPVEIRAFRSNYPAAFESAIERLVTKFYDDDLDAHLETAIEEAREEARDRLRHVFADHRESLEAAFNDLHDALDRYHDAVEPHFEAAREGLERLEQAETRAREQQEVPAKRNGLATEVEHVGYEDALRDVDVAVPTGVVDGVEDTILNTRRTLLEQVRAYARHDVRDSALTDGQ